MANRMLRLVVSARTNCNLPTDPLEPVDVAVSFHVAGQPKQSVELGTGQRPFLRLQSVLQYEPRGGVVHAQSRDELRRVIAEALRLGIQAGSSIATLRLPKAKNGTNPITWIIWVPFRV